MWLLPGDRQPGGIPGGPTVLVQVERQGLQTVPYLMAPRLGPPAASSRNAQSLLLLCGPEECTALRPGVHGQRPPAPAPRVSCEDQSQTVDHRVNSFSALLSSCFHMWRRIEKSTFSGFVSNYDFSPFPVLFPFNVYIYLAHFLEVGWGQMV